MYRAYTRLLRQFAQCNVTTYPETKWQLSSIASEASVNFMSDSDTRVERIGTAKLIRDTGHD